MPVAVAMIVIAIMAIIAAEALVHELPIDHSHHGLEVVEERSGFGGRIGRRAARRVVPQLADGLIADGRNCAKSLILSGNIAGCNKTRAL